MSIRKLELSDFDKKYFDLLEQLTMVEKAKITQCDFENFVKSLNESHIIFVIEDVTTNKIIATTTLQPI